jgi:hypothetical protein
MTEEQRAQFDRMGRTLVLGLFAEAALQETTKRAAYEWISEDDRRIERRTSDAARNARHAIYAAWVAAAAAMIAAIAAIASLVK